MNRPQPFTQHGDYKGLISLDESLLPGKEPLDGLLRLDSDEALTVVGFGFSTHNYPDYPSTLELFLYDKGHARSVKQAIEQQSGSLQVWKHEVEWEGGFDALVERTFARVHVIAWQDKLLGRRSVEILGGY
jgi:hypothetical protein